MCSDPVPPQFAYLAEGESKTAFEPLFIIAVDVASKELLGSALAEYASRVNLCIDHHRTNGDYACGTLVDDQAAAACEILYAVIAAMGVSLTPQIASCLYTGIATDSGCFKYPNTTARTHRIAAELIEAGADYAAINRRAVRYQVESARGNRKTGSGYAFLCGKRTDCMGLHYAEDAAGDRSGGDGSWTVLQLCRV